MAATGSTEAFFLPNPRKRKQMVKKRSSAFTAILTNTGLAMDFRFGPYSVMAQRRALSVPSCCLTLLARQSSPLERRRVESARIRIAALKP